MVDQVENGIPSSDAVRSFRARYREITFRNCENKDTAKLLGENFNHVKSCFDILTSIAAKYPGILQDADCIWNMDETKVDFTFGTRRKAFGASNSHHGVFTAATNTTAGKHMTAVVAVSASGRRGPPFFIVAGTHVLSSWLKPLSKNHLDQSCNLQRFAKSCWFRKAAFIKYTARVSIDMDLLAAFV